ncbi:MAG: phenylalanine--tRNA ligase subunit beta [Erysipelotrichaceae bacterium]|nr:phenylalanine--tRNA ligase subunit beta [Erysipelotrichaceae bacterium]
MRVTYNWLKQYMDLSDITPEQIAEIMTRGGLEVEGMEKVASGSDLVIGKVLECVPHPDSDHLHVCQVDTGDTVRQIVCGAPNVAAGQKVIVALPGCILPGGEIKSGVIRGQKSDGMICALFELGVDKKQLTEKQLSGIEELPEDAEVGNREVLKYLNLDDIIFDVSLTPNRADCLSIWALAKEVGALLNKKVALPDYSYETETVPATFKLSSETEKCPLFEGKIINHVVIKPSPKWLQDLLHSAGVKAINNVVDISNFVMLETGQPLHFYDLAKIPLREITVKTGLEETYTALDGIDYQIKPEDIMITTGGKAIGIAGIMGGDDSKIDDETKGIIIEAATFSNVQIRNTARRLGLDTEASQHFSKGIDPLGGHKAVERSVQLLLELAEASGIEETVLCGDPSFEPIVIDAPVNKINGLLATKFTAEQVESVFERLDFHPEKVSDDIIRVTIPSYRRDIKVWQDLSEEVVRMLGYENIGSTLPLIPTIQGGLSDRLKNKRVLQQLLMGMGMNEIVSYSLVSKSKIDEGILSAGEAVEVSNRLSDERRYFRTSLLPSMLETAGYNVARSNDEYGLFEIANVYNNDNEEQQHLCIALSNKKTISRWQKLIQENDFYTIKGIVIAIMDKLGYPEKRLSFQIESNSKAVLHPNKSASVYLDRTLVGKIGVIHPACAKKYDLDECVLAELNMTAIYGIRNVKIKFTPVPRYPAVSYDLAMVVDEEVTGEQIVKTIKKTGSSLLRDVQIFDIYRGGSIAEGSKSVAVKVTYQSDDRTLSEDDIRDVHQGIIAALKNNLHAVLRDS